MKKLILTLCFVLYGFTAFAQQLPTVAVATFDTSGGVTRDEAQVVTELFMTELVSKGTVNVVDRVNFDKIIAEMKFQTSDWSNSKKTAQLGNALNAEYIIRGQLMKMGSSIYWTATMIDVNTAQVLYSAREQVSDLGEIFGKLPAFTAQMVAKIPPPNYFVGKWQSIVTRESKTLTCKLEINPNGSIIIEQYDIYDSSKKPPAFSTGHGSGNYSFDTNSISIVLSLENVPTEYSGRSIESNYTFNGSKNTLTLSKGLFCYYAGWTTGFNPQPINDFYKSFIKIQ